MPVKNKQKIVIIWATPKNVFNLLSTNIPNSPEAWIYLGKNVRLCSEIEKNIGNRIKRITAGEILQNSARTIRKPFIEFVGSLSQKENRKSWIISAVSGKNIYETNLFLNLCYLEVFDYHVKKCSGCVWVFCDDMGLIHAIQRNFTENFDVEFYNSDKVLQKKSHMIQNKIAFICRFGLNIFYAKLFNLRKSSRQTIPQNEPIISIHSWTDERSFVTGGAFSEPYYGNLDKILDREDMPSFYVIHVLPSISYREALKKLSKIQFRYELFEGFLEFFDIIRALNFTWKKNKLAVSGITFRGYDISELLREEYERDQYSNQAEEAILYYYASKRMGKLYSIKTYLYTFENHLWERMTIEGLRESSPSTRILGYAHTTVNRMNLVYSRSEQEKTIIPTPDTILVNGNKAKDVLLESGFEDTDIQIIGSLRYGNLICHKKQVKSEKRQEIIIALSGDIDRSFELISKCAEAFRNTNISVILKLHPTISPDRLESIVKTLPTTFTISTVPLSILFHTADLMIYCDSSASAEAASQGVPVLHVKSDFMIDVNIFEDVRIISSVSTPQQILVQSCKILDGEYPPFEEVEKHIKQIFSSVDEQKLVENIL